MKYYHWGKWQIEKTSVHHRDFNYPRRLREINLGERLILVLMDVHHVQYLIKKKEKKKWEGLWERRWLKTTLVLVGGGLINLRVVN